MYVADKREMDGCPENCPGEGQVWKEWGAERVEVCDQTLPSLVLSTV